jgi:hypothetical protein
MNVPGFFLFIGVGFSVLGLISYYSAKGPDPTGRVRDLFFAPAAWKLDRKIWPFVLGGGLALMFAGIVGLIVRALGG